MNEQILKELDYKLDLLRENLKSLENSKGSKTLINFIRGQIKAFEDSKYLFIYGYLP